MNNLPEPYASAPTPMTDEQARRFIYKSSVDCANGMLDMCRNLERRLAYAEAQLVEARRKAKAFDWCRNRVFSEIEAAFIDHQKDGKSLLEAVESAMNNSK